MTKPRRYAEGTEVSVDKTKAELDKLLKDHGATQRAVFEDDAEGRAVVQFTMAGRMVRLEVEVDRSTLPDPSKSTYQQLAGRATPQNWGNLPVAGRKEWVARKLAQLEREAWRRVLLVTKAKLEVVANGSSVEREFLADLLLPDGQTVHQAMAAGIESAYSTGQMPPLLPGALK